MYQKGHTEKKSTVCIKVLKAISFTEAEQGQILHHILVYKHENNIQQSFDVFFKSSIFLWGGI